MALASVGGSLLSAFLQVLFDRMASPELLNLFRKRKADDELLKKLKINLLAVGAVLDDAENKEISSQAVKEWLEELHEIVYQADDLLDEINTEALRVKVESEYKSSTSFLVSASTYISSFSNQFFKRIMPEIQKVVISLEGFIQQINPLGLQVVESKIQSCRLPSTSLVDEDAVYGRDVEEENIIQMLLSEDEKGDDVSVVSIVGQGGIGKTTLAQLVYNDKRVKNHFPTKAWVCVSEEYNATRITKELLRELDISFSDSGESLNSLQVKLQQGLTDKKFLLVLDDVWNDDYDEWYKLKMLVKGGSEGSKIIVTTRDERIALMMGHKMSIHHLGLLSEEDSWVVFEKHAFGGKDNEIRPELEVIGKKIVNKCEGLPLAVKTIAGLLRSRSTVEEWEEILRNDLWNQTRNPNGILPALRLSYMHLPSHLKRCFAYCAVFQKDFWFSKQEIIQLWHANGLLERPRNNESIEDIGEVYLRELRLRSLLWQSTDNTFSMHDLINDLARFVSGKYCLRLEDHYPGYGTTARVRNFTYYPSYYDTFDKLKLLREAKSLRTFYPVCRSNFAFRDEIISNKFLHDVLPGFKSLRVLSLYNRSILKLPDSFRHFKQLRILNLSHTPIEKLPDWICTIYNLQTLLLSDCEHLEELPKDLGKLINLCFLDISGVPLKKMPMKMGRLKNLQVLTAFVAGKDYGLTIEELGKLPMLGGKLLISGLEKVSGGREASMANIKGKNQLESLTLKWNDDGDGSQVARDVLDGLQPHSSIKHLKINGYCGTRFPNWLETPSFCHIESISLINCEYCLRLPALGQLQSLKSLEIVGMSNISALTEDMYYGDNCEIKPFPSLRKFKIENMQQLEKWDIPEGEVFCSLEDLSIIDCPKLVGELPKQRSSLKILEISGCDRFVLSNGRLSILDEHIQQLSSLYLLTVSRMENLKELSPELNKLACLEWLKIRDCDSIKVVSLGLFPMLKDVDIGNCKGMEMLSVLPRGIGNQSSSLTSLQSLEICDCDNLMSFPDEGLPAPNLKSMCIACCKKLKSLPARMESLLPSLQGLTLIGCPEIERFPEGGLPTSLQGLGITVCGKLLTSPREWGLMRLPCLRILCVHIMDEAIESFPNEDWLLPCTLEDLTLEVGENIKTLNYSGFQHLTSLQNLRIIGCSLLQSLPEEGLPASLTKLEIWDCPLLKPRLEWEKGRDWSKVAHIPCIIVDKELIP
ncbi:putative disease resistance RPP13-like protein 1 [Coffea eugenioides]|uniref:putative disease resistance RPP13-like protein 1 n=1 Tax=Coffea eugenioides TaxID=49369 RepID=UPI000F604DED|nr:putative disease resistance RPP13-like protein 1 [Coffea eugenioides]